MTVGIKSQVTAQVVQDWIDKRPGVEWPNRQS
jgi:hypothetical protein